MPFRYVSFFVSFIILSPILSFYSSATEASIGISPAYVYADMKKRNPSGSFTVTNLTDTSQTYRARAMHFTIQENGSLLPVKPDKYSLIDRIKFNPKEFTLPPKSRRKVRFSILTRGKLDAHEYWGAIEFSPLEGKQYTGEGDDVKQFGFKVVTKLVIPIYGLMPGTPFSGQILKVAGRNTEEKIHLKAVIQNDGEGGLRVGGEWQIFEKDTAKQVKTFPINKFLILPQHRRLLDFYTDETLPKGEYIAILKLKQDKPEVLMSGQGEFSF